MIFILQRRKKGGGVTHQQEKKYRRRKRAKETLKESTETRNAKRTLHTKSAKNSNNTEKDILRVIVSRAVNEICRGRKIQEKETSLYVSNSFGTFINIVSNEQKMKCCCFPYPSDNTKRYGYVFISK